MIVTGSRVSADRTAFRAAHLINHHIERWNHIDAIPPGAPLPESVARRSCHMPVFIHVEVEAVSVVRIVLRHPAAHPHKLRRHNLLIAPFPLVSSR